MLALATVGFLFFWVSNLAFVKKFFDWVEMKANGYAEARKRREEERERLDAELRVKQAETERLAREEQLRRMKEGTWTAPPPPPPPFKERCNKKIEAILDGIIWFFRILLAALAVVWVVATTVWRWITALYSRDVYKDGQWREELGPIGVLVKGFWAMKKGACPMLQFVDDADITTTPPPPPKPPQQGPLTGSQPQQA